jgi:hypothetical protein
MNDNLGVPAPVAALIRTVSGSGDDDERAMTFARGLALGALVGAAIAGSTIWQRRQNRAGRPAAETLEDPRPE